MLTAEPQTVANILNSPYFLSILPDNLSHEHTMSFEVAGYGVKVNLNNGKTLKGIVRKVSPTALSLDNVTDLSSGKTMSTYEVPASEIEDLAVEDLPAELKFKKGKKNKNKQSNGNGGVQMQYSASQQSHNYDYHYYNGTNGSPVSSAATPKPRLLTRHKSPATGSAVYRNDTNITWDNDVSQIINGAAFDFSQSTSGFNKEQALREFSTNDDIDPRERLVSSNKKVNYSNDEMVLGNKNKKNNKNISHAIDEDDGDNESLLEGLTDLKVDSELQHATTMRERRFSSLKHHSTVSLDSKSFIITFLNSKATLPLSTPIQLLEAERAAEKLKVSQTIMNENLSRGALFTIVKILGGPSRIDDINHNLLPLVLLLIGNNKAGSRSLAIGRQLVNHGVRVVGIVNVKPEDMDSNLATQMELFNLASPSPSIVSSLKELSKLIKSIESPVELIIDGLQGYDSNLNNDLWGEELHSVKSLIEWANSQSITTLSLDIPSGIDANSGQIGDFEPINAKFVVSLGLPMNGLLSCYMNEVVERGEWTHYLVDIGLPATIFKKGNLRKFEKNWFVGASCVGLEVREFKN
ncbi:hypothetical protein WICPIJ_001364 [Wickerhamomyces pijperi]|uniref:YjeF N-terminal domain-containing protein n=1 Tax=Wickerhamomyces pijperi TaxID=599730 RepID=A0A9P8QAX2_WICPI|nr:hypothetical protein WICPIJ_001364 [Wickerhamomyces pijperi]